MTVLEELETSLGDLAAGAGQAVVGLGRGWGVGSGAVIAPGQVLTNAHNLRHDEATITFLDGRRERGRLAGSDPDLDLAVIEVDTAEVSPLRWAEDDLDPEIGQVVFALGNPGGRGLRLTPGFISSIARSFRGPRGRRIRGAIEHTAPLPRGSSGGPLLDRSGHVIGINAVRADGGLILAIPADGATRGRVAALSRGEAPDRPRLGVAIAPPRVARRLRRAVGLPEREGVLIRVVEEDTPAERAGLERGDLIARAGGQDVDRVDVLYDALESAREEGRLELVTVRGTEERTVEVSL